MILPVLTYPDERLKQKSLIADPVGIESSLVVDLLETMYAKRGVGLAAIQVGVALRILVIDVDYDEVQVDGSDVILIENKNPRVFINPVIEGGKGELSFKEGCLSVPGVNEFVTRHKQVDVSWYDETGKHHRETFGATEDQKLLAVCIQHEMDHLDGKLFIDRLSGLKKDLLRKKMLKSK